MKKDRSKEKYYKNDEISANEQKRNKIIQRRINRD